MKKILIILSLILFLFNANTYAKDNYISVIEQQQEAVDIDSLENIMDKLISKESSQIVPKFSVGEIIKNTVAGKAGLDIKNILRNSIRYLFKEIYEGYRMVLEIVVLALLCALLQNLQSAFEKDGVGEIAFYSCYILIAAMLLKGFIDALNMGKTVINNLVIFIQAFIPTIFALLISTGNITTSTVMQPSVLFTIEITCTLIKSIVLPLILYYTLLGIVNNISKRVQISKIIDFIKNTSTWLIGLLLTVMIAVLSLQSSITSVSDGIGAKTAKFAVSTFVPVVGKMLSDTVETVIGCSIILKNSLSIVGMIIIILICAIPIIKLFALILVYKLTAVMIEPISDERITKCISHMANSLTYISAAVLSVAVMFIISVAIMSNAGNTAVMLR